MTRTPLEVRGPSAWYRCLTLVLALWPTAPLAAQAAAPASPVTSDRLEGAWIGALKLELPFRVIFRITRATDSVIAIADFPEQAARNIPLAIRVRDDSVQLQLAQAGISFRGRLNGAGDSLQGVFAQAGQHFDLALTRMTALQEAELSRPQEPRRPYPYADQQVQIPHAAAGITLAGTLTHPSDSGARVPGVLLVAGAGPLDRNATVAGHRTFLVLADQLTRAGFAVLRVDKRGVGRSTGDFATATTDDFTADAAAAHAYLRAHPRVDPERVGVVGHSEGTLIAASLAAQGRGVAFTVLLAPPGIRGDSLMIARATMLFRDRGVPAEARAKDAALRRALFAALVAPGDSIATGVRVRAAVQRALSAMTDAERRALGYDATSWETGANVFLAQLAWFRRWLPYDPIPAYRGVHGPVLAVFGAMDQQVPPSLNAPSLRAVLARRTPTRGRVVVMPGVNHLMQPAMAGATTEYGRIPVTIAPSVLAELIGWLTTTASVARARDARGHR